MIIRKNPAGRKSLSLLFKGSGAEIGVESGRYSESIMEVADHMYAVDIWSSYGDYRTHVSDEKYSNIEQKARKRLEGKNVTFLKMFSADALDHIKDNELDWVYIDAAHDESSAWFDISQFYRKVKSGGIMSGHDYKKRKGFGVIEAVNKFCEAVGIDELVIFEGDRSPSWMFIKP